MFLIDSTGLTTGNIAAMAVTVFLSGLSGYIGIRVALTTLAGEIKTLREAKDDHSARINRLESTYIRPGKD